MEYKLVILSMFFTTFVSLAQAQNKAMTFENAAKQDNSYEKLDKIYKSAVNNDPQFAVFKTPEEQADLQKAYVTLLQNLGKFLKSKGFKWEKETKCFNRIYINSDGTIDYFLYNFSKNQVAPEKQAEFEILLNEFIKTQKFPITAKEKFAQCSPVKYND
ncbi:MAG: hypothetical protein RL757_2637 [Bacteroidota bacterium]|jgi:hypothetical protein